MNSIKRLARQVFLVVGCLSLIAPLLGEVDPANVVRGQLSLVQFLALELHAALLAYWAYQATMRETLLEVLGAVLLSMAAVVSGIWMTIFFGTDAVVFLEPTPTVIGFGCTSIMLVLLAGIRAAGKTLILIVVAMLLFGYFGQFFPEVVYVPEIKVTSYVTYLAYGSDGLFGRTIEIFVNIVLAFIIFGVLFEISGGDRVIENLALRLARRSRSGAIKACVIGSGIFGTISGVAISNVLTSGAFSIPSMRRIGVSNATAAGIEAAASACGQIMPPVLGAAAFFLADMVGVAYSTVAAAAVGPAILCYYAFFRQANLVRTDSNPAESEFEPELFKPIWVLFAAPPIAIVGFLLHSSAFVSVAAIAGIVACIVVALIVQGWRPTASRLCQKLPELINTALDLIVISAAIGLLLGALYSTGLAASGVILITRLGESNLAVALILTAAAVFVLGMGGATVSVYIVSATLMAPGLVNAGVPTLAAHFFVLYCGLLSLLTPPVAFASLAASTLAKADFNETCREAMKFGWTLFVIPFIIVLRPGILLIGGWREIAEAFLVAFVFISAATSTLRSRWIKSVLVMVSAAAVPWNGPQWVVLITSLAVILCLTGKLRRCRDGSSRSGRI